MRRLLVSVACAALVFVVPGGPAALADTMSPPPPPPPPPQHGGGGTDSPGVVVFTPQVPPQQFAPAPPKRSTPRSQPTPAGQDFAANLPPADTPADPAVDPAVALAGDAPPAGKTVFNVAPAPDPNDAGGGDPNVPLVAVLGLVGVAIAAAPDPKNKAKCAELARRAAKARGVQIKAASLLSAEQTAMYGLESTLSQAQSTLQSLNQQLADAAADPNRGNVATIMGQLEMQKAVVQLAQDAVDASNRLQARYRDKMLQAAQRQAAIGSEMAAEGCVDVAGVDMSGDIDAA